MSHRPLEFHSSEPCMCKDNRIIYCFCGNRFDSTKKVQIAALMAERDVEFGLFLYNEEMNPSDDESPCEEVD